MSASTRRTFSFQQLIQLLDYWIPVTARQSQAQLRKGRLILWMCVVVINLCVGYIAFYAFLKFYLGIWICLYGMISGIALMFYFRKTGNFKISANFFAFTSYVFFSLFTLISHGLSTSISCWIIMVPVTAFLVGTPQSGRFWTFASVVWVIFFFFLGNPEQYFPQMFPEEQIPLVNMASITGIIFFLVLITWYYEAGRKFAEQTIEQAMAENENQRQLLVRKNEEITSINKNLEILIEKRTADLVEKIEELDTFLYQSSHALRRPLSRVTGLVSLFRTGISEAEVEFIRSKTELTYSEMDLLLRKLMLISEIFQRTPGSEPILLEHFIQVVLKQMSSRHKPETYHFSRQIPTGLTIQTDKKLFAAGLIEILSNAFLYSREEGVLASVIMEVNEVGETIEIAIRDEGCGLQEAFVSEAFKMFSRGTNRSSGTGLGLYLAQNAIRKIGGKITLDSKLNEGTEVIIRLPKNFQSEINEPAEMT